MGIRTLVVTGVVAAITITALQAQSTKPGPEVQRLGVLIGKWTTEGQAQASPYGPAGKTTSVETFAWLPGGFFMEHHWDAKQAGNEIKGMEVIAWDKNAKVYTTRFFDSLGNSGFWKGTLNGNTWTWTAESEVAGKPLRERGTWVVSGDTIAAKFEYSTDGATWKPNFEAKMTRAK